MDDAFLNFVIEALNVMNPRFAAANPVLEFYHQFRRLWDKALPVQMGLGHLVIQPEPNPPPGPQPDLLVWQLEPERRLAAIKFGATEPLVNFDIYPVRVCIGYGAEPPEAVDLARIHYDTTRRVARLLG
ncbi:MAG: hypothetical protein U0791_13460 [Gemmataceae bacterium]